MQKTYFNGKIKQVLTIGICVLFIVVVFSSTLVKSEKKSSDQDLNWWSKRPNMFSIPFGNVGIGTMNPIAKLDVYGNIAINGVVIIDASGHWVGSPTGLVGPPGPKGIQGPKGEKGDKGDKGAKGDIGAQGLQGIQGLQGEQGLKGDKGDTGATSPQGIQGEQGPKGEQGLTGPQGPPGNSFIGFTQQTTNLFIPSVNESWFDIPGVILNFTLSTTKYVDFRAFGCSDAEGYIGFRFFIDGVGYGHPLYGELYIYPYERYMPWSLERIVSLQPGEHSVKLQVLHRGAFGFTCYAYDYLAVRMFVQAW